LLNFLAYDLWIVKIFPTEILIQLKLINVTLKFPIFNCRNAILNLSTIQTREGNDQTIIFFKRWSKPGQTAPLLTPNPCFSWLFD
jgi:hypothetical protein